MRLQINFSGRNNFFLILRMGLCKSAYPEFLIDAWDQWDDEENSENDRPGEAN